MLLLAPLDPAGSLLYADNIQAYVHCSAAEALASVDLMCSAIDIALDEWPEIVYFWIRRKPSLFGSMSVDIAVG